MQNLSTDNVTFEHVLGNIEYIKYVIAFGVGIELLFYPFIKVAQITMRYIFKASVNYSLTLK